MVNKMLHYYGILLNKKSLYIVLGKFSSLSL